MSFQVKEHYTLDDCAALISMLRHPGGCPWDQEQTHQSIRRNYIEEVYEAADAIDRDDPANLCEELGDVLLQTLFHADIEADAGRFTLEDVCDSLCRKMIFRHPHLFGAAEEAPDWEAIKRAEKGQTSHTEVLRGVPKAMPALWRAEKTVSKAEKAGIRAADPAEAVRAVQDAAAALDGSEASLGNALLALAALSHAMDCDPERALDDALTRSVERFAACEAAGTLPETTAEMLWKP